MTSYDVHIMFVIHVSYGPSHSSFTAYLLQGLNTLEHSSSLLKII